MHCPSCKSDLDGGPIPEDLRKHYSPPYRWGREVGLSDGDSVFAWKCPDCGHQWNRQEYGGTNPFALAQREST